MTPELDMTLIQQACQLLENSLSRGPVMQSPGAVKDFCRLSLGLLPDEHFACLFLDSQHRLIASEILFRGTVDGAAVYPRVVVRRTLELNAAAVIFAHNHPSGVAEPSTADRRITERLSAALALIDVRVLDHLVVSVNDVTSFAECGLL